MTATSHLNITLVEQSQAQKEVTVNQALICIDALLNTGSKSQSVATPPGSPASGDVYIVAGSATGAWSGQSGKIAYFDQIWRFIVPQEGITLWVNDEDVLYSYNGSAWVKAVNTTVFQNLTMLGVNATADATNKLSVASSAALFNHIGGDMQIKVNKNSGSNKASFLFQNAFSARAEFGLLGDDNFTLKVSSDGSTFYDAIKLLAGSGRMALKSIGAGLSAAGSTQGTATVITKQLNEFTTVGSGQGAILPSPEAGESITIINAGANSLNVYPATGHAINALSANVAFSLATGKTATFYALTTGKWYSLLSA